MLVSLDTLYLCPQVLHVSYPNIRISSYVNIQPQVLHVSYLNIRISSYVNVCIFDCLNICMFRYVKKCTYASLI